MAITKTLLLFGSSSNSIYNKRDVLFIRVLNRLIGRTCTVHINNWAVYDESYKISI